MATTIEQGSTWKHQRKGTVVTVQQVWDLGGKKHVTFTFGSGWEESRSVTAFLRMYAPVAK